MDYTKIKKHIRWDIKDVKGFKTILLLQMDEKEDIEFIGKENIIWENKGFYIVNLWVLKFIDDYVYKIKNFYLLSDERAMRNVMKKINSPSFNPEHTKIEYYYKNTNKSSSKAKTSSSYAKFLYWFQWNAFIENRLTPKEKELFDNESATIAFIQRLMNRYKYAFNQYSKFKDTKHKEVEHVYKNFSNEYKISSAEKLELYKWKLSNNRNIFKLIKFLDRYPIKITYNKNTKIFYFKKNSNKVVLAPENKFKRGKFSFIINSDENNIECLIKHSEVRYPKYLLKYIIPTLNLDHSIIDYSTQEFDLMLDNIIGDSL